MTNSGYISNIICDKVFQNGQSEICRRQLLKNLKWYGLLNPLSASVVLI